MTGEEIADEISRIGRDCDIALEEIRQFAKNLVPQLRDLNQNSTADRLDAALDKCERLEKERDALIATDPHAVLAVMLERMSRRK